MTTEPDMVNHPPHYTSGPAKCSDCGKTVECIDVTRYMSFNLGNVIKYVWRSGLKDSLLENLRKAEFYLRDEIARLEGKTAQVDGQRTAQPGTFELYRDRASKWRWRLKASNGQVIATGEAHERLPGAHKQCADVSRFSARAKIVEVDG